jgi:3-dehydroquinate synthase
MNHRTVAVELGDRSYDILIGRSLIAETGALLAERFPGARFAVITDETVAGLHLPALSDAMHAASLDPVVITIPSGERSKSINELNRVVEELLAARLERSDMVIAFGGGVVGDLAGFAAAWILSRSQRRCSHRSIPASAARPASTRQLERI